MLKEIEDYVKGCVHCSEKRRNHKEPLIPTYWTTVSSLGKSRSWPLWHLVMIDYYSKYVEWAYRPSTTLSVVISRLLTIFSRHGILPFILFTDNGSQLTWTEVQQFADKMNFSIITRSPSFPQSNGLAGETAARLQITHGGVTLLSRQAESFRLQPSGTSNE